MLLHCKVKHQQNEKVIYETDENIGKLNIWKEITIQIYIRIVTNSIAKKNTTNSIAKKQTNK